MITQYAQVMLVVRASHQDPPAPATPLMTVTAIVPATALQVTFSIAYTSMTVDWGDGTVQDFPVRQDPSTPAQVQHTYAEAGTYAAAFTSEHDIALPYDAFHSCQLEAVMVASRDMPLLGRGAFYGSTAMTALYLHTSSFRTIGNYSFAGCTSLETVYLPTVLEVLDGAWKYGYSPYDGVFSGCTSLADLNLPASLKVLGADCFRGCSALQYIGYPASLEYVGAGAFQGCTALTQITLPDSVRYLGSWPSGAPVSRIPFSTDTYAEKVFFGLGSGFTAKVFPPCGRVVHSRAFMLGGGSLATFHFLARPEVCGEQPFDSMPVTDVYVPWQQADNPSGFPGSSFGTVHYGHDMAGVLTEDEKLFRKYTPPASLPYSYIPLEYIQGDGNAYIDTGVTVNTSDCFMLDSRVVEFRRKGYFGGGPDESHGLCIATPGNGILGAFAGSRDSACLEFEPGYVRFITEYRDGCTYVDGVHRSSLSDTSYTSSDTLHIFNCSWSDGQACTMAVYRCTITSRQGAVRRDFYPVKRVTDGACGLYDSVTQAFYGNQGTGSFTAGPELSRTARLEDGILPAGYARIWAARLSASSYIDTGLHLSSPAQASLKFYERGTENAEQFYFGAMDGDNSGNITVRYVFNGQKSWTVKDDSGTGGTADRRGDNEIITMSVDKGAVTLHVTDNSGTQLKYSASLYTSRLYPQFVCGRTCWIGACNRESDPAVRANLDVMEFKSRGRRHMIAAKRISDGKIGMYDLLGSTCSATGTPFYVNAASSGDDITEDSASWAAGGKINWYDPEPEGDYAWYSAPDRLSLFTSTDIDWNGYNAGALMLHFTNASQTVFRDWFRGTGVTAVTMAPYISSLQESAFRGCTALASAKLSEGIPSIGADTFRGCTALSLDRLPGAVTSIGASAFQDCSALALKGLPPGLLSIGASAFSGCTSLKLTEIPASVSSIGAGAFSGCWSTRTGSLRFMGTPASIADDAFGGCTGLYIRVPWASGAVAGAPWGLDASHITYGYTGQ